MRMTLYLLPDQRKALFILGIIAGALFVVVIWLFTMSKMAQRMGDEDRNIQYQRLAILLLVIDFIVTITGSWALFG